jgi:hypothetical protein
MLENPDVKAGECSDLHTFTVSENVRFLQYTTTGSNPCEIWIAIQSLLEGAKRVESHNPSNAFIVTYGIVSRVDAADAEGVTYLTPPCSPNQNLFVVLEVPLVRGAELIPESGVPYATVDGSIFPNGHFIRRIEDSRVLFGSIIAVWLEEG